MTAPLLQDDVIVIPNVTEVDVGSATVGVSPATDAYTQSSKVSDRQPPPPYVPSTSDSGVYRPGLGG